MSRNIYKNEKLSVKILNFIKTLTKYVFLYLTVAVIFIAITYLLIKGYTYITTTNIFGLKYIKIKGIKILKKEYVLNKLGLTYGENIFDINLFELKKKLLKDNWIKEVTIKRIIPDKIIINITEKIPVFILKDKNNLFYIDKNGNIISKVNKYIILNLPIVEIYNKDDTILKQIVYTRFPVPNNYIGWIKIDPYYLSFFDYRYDIMWKIDIEDLNNSLVSANLLWKDLERSADQRRIKEIIVIGKLGWVTYNRREL